MRRDLSNVALLWLGLTILGELLVPLLPFPLAAAREADISDESFRILLYLGVPVFMFVVSMLGYSLWKFRATDDKLEDGIATPENPWVTGLWLGITASLCLVVIVNPGLTGMAKMFGGSQIAQLEVRVVGHQWNWEVDYPKLGLTGVKELVLPIDQQVRFDVASADVLHAFWIPAFRMKVDAIPGQVTTLYVTPNKLGSMAEDSNLRVQCTEICGMSHAGMNLPVRVVSAEDFKAWSDAQLAAQPSNAILRGQRLADSQGCAKCHSIDGSTIVGPTWKDVFGNEVELADGSKVMADEAYLKESILNPNAKIVKGFNPDVMPKTFGTVLGEDQIKDLLAYIKSLSPKGNHIDANLTEYVIALSSDAAREGDVTFTIQNNSTTTMHEMIVLKTDLKPADLPKKDDGSLDEDKLTENQDEAKGDMIWKIGALEDIEQGKGGDITINMPPGHYVMFCNKPGHFKLAMYTEFTVLPQPGK